MVTVGPGVTVAFGDIWESKVQGASSPRTPRRVTVAPAVQAGQEAGVLQTPSSAVLVLTLRRFRREAKVPRGSGHRQALCLCPACPVA